MSAPKSDTATIAARQSRLVELLAEGKSQTEAAEILRSEGHPASDPTITRDVRELGPRWAAATIQDFAASASEQYIWLQGLKADLANPNIKADRRIELALSILDREMKLLGTAAPTKSIQAHVSSSESSPLFLKFKKATAGLSEAQLEAAFAQLASIPREAVVTVRDASWFPAPEPKQLESGE
jgi:hypothetical protein